MKSTVAIALIVSGVILVALPPISDYFWRADAIRSVQITGMSNLTLDGKMEQGYRLGCFLAGVAAIGVAVRSSLVRPRGKGRDGEDFA